MSVYIIRHGFTKCNKGDHVMNKHNTLVRFITQLIQTNMLLCHTVPLGQGVDGFVYRSKMGRYHIFISDKLSPESQRRVFFHEVWHVIEDMPRKPFIIGINMQNQRFEHAAKMFEEYANLHNEIIVDAETPKAM